MLDLAGDVKEKSETARGAVCSGDRASLVRAGLGIIIRGTSPSTMNGILVFVSEAYRLLKPYCSSIGGGIGLGVKGGTGPEGCRGPGSNIEPGGAPGEVYGLAPRPP